MEFYGCFYEDYIELSDKHVLWEIGSYDVDEYYMAVDDLVEEFEKMYDARLFLLGRSSRHVCVENTPDNRRRVYNMTRTVERMQRDLIKMFS